MIIERTIQIGKPLRIKDIKSNGKTIITNDAGLRQDFNSATPTQRIQQIVANEQLYGVMVFEYSWGSFDDMSIDQQIESKFLHVYHNADANLHWYRFLFPLLNGNPRLVKMLQNIVRVTPPSRFLMKTDAVEAKAFATAVHKKRGDKTVKRLIWEAFKNQRGVANAMNLGDMPQSSAVKGTINVLMKLEAGKQPSFAGIKVFGSNEVKDALKAHALMFYRGFIAPHLSIFEDRLKMYFQSQNFTVYAADPTLGEMFADVFDHFRTASVNSEDSLRAKVIRLAHQNPELRKDLLPLLKEARVHDKALALRIQNSRAGKAFGLYFAAGFKSNRADSDGAITYEFETSIKNGNVKEVIYIDVTTFESEDDPMFSVQAKYGKGTWDYYSEKDFLRNLPNVLANLKKQLG